MFKVFIDFLVLLGSLWISKVKDEVNGQGTVSGLLLSNNETTMITATTTRITTRTTTVLVTTIACTTADGVGGDGRGNLAITTATSSDNIKTATNTGSTEDFGRGSNDGIGSSNASEGGRGGGIGNVTIESSDTATVARVGGAGDKGGGRAVTVALASHCTGIVTCKGSGNFGCEGSEGTVTFIFKGDNTATILGRGGFGGTDGGGGVVSGGGEAILAPRSNETGTLTNIAGSVSVGGGESRARYSNSSIWK